MTTDKLHDVLFKILLIGDSSAGKTDVLLAFVPDPKRSVGVDFCTKTVELDDHVVKLQIWDTAGQERFRTVTTAYFRGASGAVLVYCVSDKKSFESVTHWMDNINTHGKSGIKVILVGNVRDKGHPRQVSTESGQELADQLGVPFFETEGKTGHNVEQMFLTLTSLILKDIQKEECTKL